MRPGVRELAPQDDYLVLKALVFPYINLLWLGVLVMFAGFILSLLNRQLKGKKAVHARTTSGEPGTVFPKDNPTT